MMIQGYSCQQALPFLRASRSWRSTQWMPCLRSAALSWMCWEENVPFLVKITFTANNAKHIAIINTLISKVSVIFYNFVATKIVQFAQSTK